MYFVCKTRISNNCFYYPTMKKNNNLSDPKITLIMLSEGLSVLNRITTSANLWKKLQEHEI